MKALKFGILAALALASVQAQAFLLVQLVNDTDTVCKLQNYELRHGRLITPVPQRIAANSDVAFNADDSGYYGPELELIYVCGNKKVMLNCQEDIGRFSAGDVHARLDYADPGISAQFTLQNGSYYWNQAGIINWTIIPLASSQPQPQPQPVPPAPQGE